MVLFAPWVGWHYQGSDGRGGGHFPPRLKSVLGGDLCEAEELVQIVRHPARGEMPVELLRVHLDIHNHVALRFVALKPSSAENEPLIIGSRQIPQKLSKL